MISFEPSSSIFKSISPSNFSQRKPIVIFCNYNTSLSPARNSHCDLSTAARSYSIRFSYDERRIRSKIRLAARNNGGREQISEVLETERDVLAREVHCEVEVISWRERRIKGEIHVNADAESVWNALTDYERLADFVPNLVFSGRIPCPHPGRIWLEQRGLQRALYWHIEARVVLDLQESVNSSYDRELHFSMVDGDFKKFEGKWSVKSSRRKSSTLSYEVSVIPRFNFPAIFLERIIQSDLPVNLRALASRAECKSEVDPKMGLNTESTLVKTSEVSYSDGGHADKLVPTEPNNKSLSGSSIGKVAQISEANDTWGVFGNVCKLERPRMVDEIHLRRFDGLVEDGGVHRSVTASITIKAPVHEVWKVLTAYESLPEIVPNLAISKILSRDNNRVRILQEGCKGLLYMVLHARVVLDLCEQLEREIRFEQVEGDFDSFHGKWQLEQLGNHHTMLKYSVESKMRRDTFLSEALMEEVIYEDLPSNLCAIRDSIEKLIGSKNDLIGSDEADANTLNPVSETGMDSCSNPTNPVVKPGTTKGTFRQRPRVPGLQRDFEVLKSELRAFIIEYGQEGFMPMRKQLRLHGRVDIEKAINRKGGFRKVASLMNLSLAYKQRKPKGYWDNLENLEDEIGRFQKNWGMDPSYMPSRKSFERAGRYDIARALEKWGGLHEVSRLLSFKVRHPNKQYSITKEKRTSDDTDSSGNTVGEDKGTSKSPYVSQDTQKWMSKLKQLDINCPF